MYVHERIHGLLFHGEKSAIDHSQYMQMSLDRFCKHTYTSALQMEFLCYLLINTEPYKSQKTHKKFSDIENQTIRRPFQKFIPAYKSN